MRWPSKGQGQGGKLCQGTGARTGRATATSMAKPSPLRSQPVMAAAWSPTMLPHLAGPSAKLSPAPNSAEIQTLSIVVLSKVVVGYLGIYKV